MKRCINYTDLAEQYAWSQETFGPGTRLKGVLDHIRKELVEIEANPEDVTEWVDALILVLDGAMRSGHDPQDIIDSYFAKRAKNRQRTWPDWRTMPEDRAIEHVREEKS